MIQPYVTHIATLYCSLNLGSGVNFDFGSQIAT